MFLIFHHTIYFMITLYLQMKMFIYFTIKDNMNKQTELMLQREINCGNC